MLQRINQKYPSTCCPSAKHPKHSTWNIVNMQEKTSSVFTSGDTTLAITKSLLISIPLQKLQFLYIFNSLAAPGNGSCLLI